MDKEETGTCILGTQGKRWIVKGRGSNGGGEEIRDDGCRLVRG